MKSLFESLLRLYEFDGPALISGKARADKGVEQRLLELPAEDESTFPYLP